MRWKLAQWFEVRWWQRYLKRKSPQAYLAWKKAYWREFLDALQLNELHGLTVLDAGCGPAGIFTTLDHCKVTAIDPLLDNYTESLPHFDQTAFPYVTFRNERIEMLQERSSYDYVFCLNVINHVEHIEQSLIQLIQSLRPSGKLVLSIDTHNYTLPKHIFRLAPFDVLHPHQYDLQEYLALLQRHGLELDRVVHIKAGFLFDYYALVAKKH
jgi:2-polyprenyl-6-hydroxyphenyl methylase/3-demethylubiquinone-9 3-methyltransferase